MLTMLFLVLMFMLFGRILVFALKAAWGLSRIICTVVLLPLFLIGLVVVGLLKLAFPILLLAGVVFLVAPRVNG